MSLDKKLKMLEKLINNDEQVESYAEAIEQEIRKQSPNLEFINLSWIKILSSHLSQKKAKHLFDIYSRFLIADIENRLKENWRKENHKIPQ
jgi:hypothetical protein